MGEDHKLTVRAVERALDILICFIDEYELSLTQISKRAGINKSTVHRLLATLEEKGFLLRSPDTEKYRLGFRIWELSANLTKDDDPAVLFLPDMERLRDRLDETVSLYVRDNKERIRIQAVESRQTIRRVAPIGARLPLSVGASSKVLVAYEEPEVVEMILRDPEWPDNVDKRWYEDQLRQIRASGYAVSLEEREPGTSAISAPIISHRGRLVAALAVSGPVGRLTLEKMNRMAPLVIEAAKRMGRMIK
jgi:DNA-binding IclR family transcriptional regulator